MTTSDLAIYSSTTNTIVDLLQGTTHQTARSRLEALKPEYGADLILLTPDEAMNRYEAAFKSGPEEITEQRFWDMLEVLPPVTWHTTSDGESFKMCERTAGAITGIYVRIGKRYFTFSDDIRTPHRECCRRVAEHIARSKA